MFPQNDVRKGLAAELLTFLKLDGSTVFTGTSFKQTNVDIGFAVGNVWFWKHGTTDMLRIYVSEVIQNMLRVPTSPPASPIAGHCYYDASTHRLYVREVFGWRWIELNHAP